MNENIELYNNWANKLKPDHIRNIIKSTKRSIDNENKQYSKYSTKSTKFLIGWKEQLEKITLGEYVLTSSLYIYDLESEKARKIIFSNINQDMLNDVKFLLRVLGCVGIGYTEQSTLGEYYPYFQKESLKLPRGAECLISFFDIQNGEISFKKNIFSSKRKEDGDFSNFLGSVGSFLKYSNFQNVDEKVFLIDFLKNENFKNGGLFFSEIFELLSEKYLEQKEMQNKVEETVLSEIAKMNIKQLQTTALLMGGALNLKVSSAKKETTNEIFFNKEHVLCLLKKWNQIISLTRKTEEGDNLYFMNNIASSSFMKYPEYGKLLLRKEQLKETIVEENNKDCIKVTINPNLMIATIQTSIQKMNEDNSNRIACTNVNKFYKGMIEVFQKDASILQKEFGVTETKIEGNPSFAKNVLATFVVKVENDKNVKENVRRVKDLLISCLDISFSKIYYNGEYDFLKDVYQSEIDLAIMKQERDILNLGVTPKTVSMKKF